MDFYGVSGRLTAALPVTLTVINGFTAVSRMHPGMKTESSGPGPSGLR